MWEIAEAFKLEHGVGSRGSAWLRLGSDPSRALVLSEVEWIRMTMGEIRWIPPLPTTAGGGSTNVGDDG